MERRRDLTSSGANAAERDVAESIKSILRDGVPKRTAHLMYNPKSNSLRVLAKEDDITINIIKTDSMRDAKLELVSKDRKRLKIEDVPINTLKKVGDIAYSVGLTLSGSTALGDDDKIRDNSEAMYRESRRIFDSILEKRPEDTEILLGRTLADFEIAKIEMKSMSDYDILELGFKIYELSILINNGGKENDGFKANALGSRAWYLFDEVCKRNPMNGEALIGRSRVEFSMGNLASALKAAEMANILSNGNIEALVMKADVAVKAELYEEAEKVLREALKIMPNNEEANRAMGGVMMAMGRRADALMYYNTVLNSDPEDIDSLSAKATLVQEIEDGLPVCEDEDGMNIKSRRESTDGKSDGDSENEDEEDQPRFPTVKRRLN